MIPSAPVALAKWTRLSVPMLMLELMAPSMLLWKTLVTPLLMPLFMPLMIDAAADACRS